MQTCALQVSCNIYFVLSLTFSLKLGEGRGALQQLYKNPFFTFGKFHQSGIFTFKY